MGVIDKTTGGVPDEILNAVAPWHRNAADNGFPSQLVPDGYEAIPNRLELSVDLTGVETLMLLMKEHGVKEIKHGTTHIIMAPPVSVPMAQPVPMERKEHEGPTERQFAYAHAGGPPINIREAKDLMKS